ncbi:helix-turn-helix domain-containing protein [Hymenobacter profundi]|uniref:AraC family transcriptional regulator n=1 Tax=Hymenobacter profundi TaxID=1982110 RepID=A0ABS6X180_9BACT|nr:AraC family transcriptional regulator [Hymenobacter profundi]MBW3129439.1 AraC family transcriptional regulator [Hymenobacter profundi]
MTSNKPLRIKTITEGHRIMGLPKPEHPLISVVEYAALQAPSTDATDNGVVFDFYYISLKRGFSNKFYYGQQQYDFDDGMLYFVAPNQVIRGAGPNPEDDLSGWVLLVHPDLLWGTTLASTIKKYEYFDYSVNEALFLSAREENIVNGIIKNIETEYQSNIDKFSGDIIVSHLETLLNYSERFYQRQFITRKRSNHQIIDRLEKLMADYFNSNALAAKGLPSVQYISSQLNISPNYLRGLLNILTGKNTQQYIHDKLIDKAKEKLSTTDLSVSEIAYELGFEHPQSFSKLFKTKTSVSPLEFRQSFN